MDITPIIGIVFIMFSGSFVANIIAEYTTAKFLSKDLTKFITLLLGLIFTGVVIYAFVVEYILRGL